MTTPASVLTASTSSGVLTGSAASLAALTAGTSCGALTGTTASLATLTAADAAGIAAPRGLLDESGAGSLLQESTDFILTEDGG